jgi:hypothetical protein
MCELSIVIVKKTRLSFECDLDLKKESFHSKHRIN